MDRLLEGYRRFRAEVWPAAAARYEALADEGQRPGTLVIACSDSRVDPQTVFGARPGELFVVRNVAGLVPPYQPDVGYHGTSAALEYGVRVLKVSRVVLLGHAQCGGIKTMVEGAPAEARDFVEGWMSMAQVTARPVPPGLATEDIYIHYETEVIRVSLANLKSFPWIRDAVAAGTLELRGYRFDIRSGVLASFDGERWTPVV
jgi:carbonic anhydrase